MHSGDGRQAFGEDTSWAFDHQAEEAAHDELDMDSLAVAGQISQLARVTTVDALGSMTAYGTTGGRSEGVDENGDGVVVAADVLGMQLIGVKEQNGMQGQTLSGGGRTCHLNDNEVKESG
jgi:hypothetical protein